MGSYGVGIFGEELALELRKVIDLDQALQIHRRHVCDGRVLCSNNSKLGERFKPKVWSGSKERRVEKR